MEVQDSESHKGIFVNKHQLLLVVWLIVQSEKSTFLILISITEIAQTESLHGMH